MGTLAISGGIPVREKPFSLWPEHGERDEQAVLETLRSGKWGIEGKKTAEFAERFAEYQQAQYGLCVANGTVSLIVALKAAGIGAGDEVIIPPYTFVATASAVLEVNAVPVFADISPASYCIDPETLEEKITAETRAIIPVHIGGHPADMDRIREIAEKHDLTVIEDAAQAHGAEWKGQRVGAIGDLGSFSFQSSKNLSCGEGGILVTDDRELFARCFSYHNCGRVLDGEWYEHHVLGQNFRMTEIQAALLLAQFERLDEQMNRRSQNAEYLTGELSRVPGISPLGCEAYVTRHAHHIYIFKYDNDVFGGLSREVFIDALRAEGIPASSGYVPLYKEKIFQGKAEICALECRRNKPPDYSRLTCEETEKASYREGVWLGQSTLLGGKEDMDDIAGAVARIQRHVDELL